MSESLSVPVSVPGYELEDVASVHVSADHRPGHQPGRDGSDASPGCQLEDAPASEEVGAGQETVSQQDSLTEKLGRWQRREPGDQ